MELLREFIKLIYKLTIRGDSEAYTKAFLSNLLDIKSI
jgi:hypothetical protein